MLQLIKALVGRIQTTSVKKAIRTGLVATAVIFVPGLLGWLHDLTSWANSQGQSPMPDGRNLAYLAVSATTGGLIAVGNFVLLAIEDMTGKGLLRDVRPPPPLVDVDPAPGQD